MQLTYFNVQKKIRFIFVDFYKIEAKSQKL